MWTCRLCHISFAFESIEQHMYVNHLKPQGGRIKVYNCGECMFTGEGFEDIALHCVSRRHRPTLITKGAEHDTYVARLFFTLEDTMTANLPISATNGHAGHYSSPAGIGSVTSYFSDDDETKLNSSTTSSDFSTSTKKVGNIVAWSSSEKLTGNDVDPFDDVNSFLDDTVNEDNHQTSVIVSDHQKESTGKDSSNQEEKPAVGSEKTFAQTTSNHENDKDGDEGKGETLEDDMDDYNNYISPPKRVQTYSDKYPRNHSCSYCQKLFTSSTHVKIHERVHTGEKPFKCDQCGKKFRQRPTLEAHKRIHTGEKPFSCTLCDKKFVEKTNCTRHMRTHKNEINLTMAL